MFLFPAVAFAVVVLLVRGGRLSAIAGIRLRMPLLAALGFGLTTYTYRSGLYWDRPTVGRVVWVLGIGLVIAFLARNRAYPGLVVAGVGALCNAVVVLANHGRMPTGHRGWEIFQLLPHWYRQPGLTDNPRAVLPFADAHTHLNFLADVIWPFMPMSFPFSIGDVLLGVGVTWVLAKAMLARDDRQHENGSAESSVALPDARRSHDAAVPTPRAATAPTPFVGAFAAAGLRVDASTAVDDLVAPTPPGDELAQRRADRAAETATDDAFTWSLAPLGTDVPLDEAA